MAEKIRDRFKSVWNVFRYGESNWNRTKDPWGFNDYSSFGFGYGYRPDRVGGYPNRSIMASVVNRIAVDAAAVELRHVRLDEFGRYLMDLKSGLNECLQVEANIDQTGRQFREDLVLTILEEGVAAIVPVDTSDNPNKTGSYDIRSMRVGKILEWYPRGVLVEVYNDRTGNREELRLSKEYVAIVENPFYTVMNETNSTMKRLARKLKLLDVVDEISGSGRLDVIIQLPYVVKSEARREQAEKRRKMIEEQLKGSQYGIAYTDGTEKIVQLNRPSDNNMMKQVQYLQGLLFSELGLTQAILDGTADDKTMLNYQNRVVEPIVAAIADAMSKTFLTKTARTQGQKIRIVNDPFRLVTMSQLAEVADRFTRNEILSSNEVRSIMGFPPSNDPRADELVNKNMPQVDSDGREHVEEDIVVEER